MFNETEFQLKVIDKIIDKIATDLANAIVSTKGNIHQETVDRYTHCVKFIQKRFETWG